MEENSDSEEEEDGDAVPNGAKGALLGAANSVASQTAAQPAAQPAANPNVQPDPVAIVPNNNDALPLSTPK